MNVVAGQTAATFMDEFNGDQTPASIWLRYALTPSITPALQRQFLQHYPDPAELTALLQSATPNIETGDETFNQSAVAALHQRFCSQVDQRLETAMKWAEQSPARHIISLHDATYPKALLATRNAPPVLYVNGDANCLNTPCVAIVGSRKATHNALEQARHIARALADKGISIISGLALGTDRAAHLGALDVKGLTIAVSATGPERIYPASHRGLAAGIEASGAIVTEFPLFSNLRPHCFPRRNRIISGMSLGVLVIEAALPSGTLTTAQHALRQGREVMAMPGAIQNPMTRGCHELLKTGAALVENADDVLACLSTELGRHLVDIQTTKPSTDPTVMQKKLTNMPPDTITLLDCLGFDPASIDTLVRRSGLAAGRVASALTHLELSGVIVADPSGRYTRCKQSGT